MSPSDQRSLAQAEGYLELNLPHQALIALERISRPPRNEFDWNKLMGECCRSLDQYPRALEHLHKAAQLRPDDYSIYLALGWCQKRLGHLDRAIAALQTAQRRCKTKLDDDAKALLCYNLSCYFSLAGRKDEMLAHLAEAIQMNAHFRRMIDAESDFDPFRDDRDFRSLVGGGM